MTSWEDEHLHKQELEQQLAHAREKNREFKQLLDHLCDHKQEYITLFNERVSRLEFLASRYKDKDSYDRLCALIDIRSHLLSLLNKCE